MADNRTSDEIRREDELGDNRSEELLEELVADDMEIESSDDHVTYNEDNEKIEAEKINSENEDGSAIVDELHEEEVPVQKKQSKIFRILIGAIAVLSIILTIGIILYFTGFFDPEEEKMQDKKIEKKVAKKDDVIFDNATIDKNKLNKKLTMLTKHEIMEKEALEAEEKKKEEEKKRKEEEAKKKREDALKAKLEEEQRNKMQEEKFIQAAKELEETKKQIQEEKASLLAQQEEFLKLQEEQKALLEEQKLEILEQIKESAQKEVEAQKEMQEVQEMKAEEVAIKEEKKEEENIVIETMDETVESNPNSFLPFINVATIKGKLYKSFLDKVENIEKSISLCRDNKNRIEVYFGPYDSNKERSKVFEKLSENGFKDAYLIEFTQEEYDKRCKY